MRAGVLSVAHDPRWADDPSPSWDTCAARAGVELHADEDTPGSPYGDLEVVTQKLWPLVPLAAQEVR